MTHSNDNAYHVYSLNFRTHGGRPLLSRLGAAGMRDELGQLLSTHPVALHGLQSSACRLGLLVSGHHAYVADFIESLRDRVGVRMLEGDQRTSTAWDDRIAWVRTAPGLADLELLVKLLTWPVRDGMIDRVARWPHLNSLRASLAPLRSSSGRLSARGLRVAPLPRYADLSPREVARSIRAGIEEIEVEYANFTEAA